MIHLQYNFEIRGDYVVTPCTESTRPSYDVAYIGSLKITASSATVRMNGTSFYYYCTLLRQMYRAN